MKRSAAVLSIALSVFVAPTAFTAEAPQATFDYKAPEGWYPLPNNDNVAHVFLTAPKKEDSLYVLVRPIKTPDQGPMQWAQDEVKALLQRGSKIHSEPQEVKFANNRFVKMVSESTALGIQVFMEQHYAQLSPTSVLEVAVMGPEELFNGQRDKIRSFLESFRLP